MDLRMGTGHFSSRLGSSRDCSPHRGRERRQCRDEIVAHAVVQWPDGLGSARPVSGCRSTTEPSLAVSIQDVYRFDHRRILAGRVESGTLRVGDKILFRHATSSARSNRSRVGHTVRGRARMGRVHRNQLTEQIFVERGQIGSGEEDAPIEEMCSRRSFSGSGGRISKWVADQAEADHGRSRVPDPIHRETDRCLDPGGDRYEVAFVHRPQRRG